MEAIESGMHQVYVKLLDSKHKALNFTAPSISVAALKHRIQTVTSIPGDLQLLLINNSRILYDHQILSLTQRRVIETLDSNCNGKNSDLAKFPLVVNLILRIRGGKGGFGSLLRGAATKAGQKKTNNFDACRDMSGRRLRHVNAEKKLEEWRAEAEERRLEKVAEEYIKKKTKEAVKSGKSKGDDGTEKYVAKYREDSAKCMEEIERSVRESIKGLESLKRKNGVEGSEFDSKRLKIWYGKRKLGDSDSEDDSDEEKEGGDEKSVIIDTGDHSDSSKEIEGSSGSVTGGNVDAVSPDQGSSGNSSEQEDTTGDDSKSKNGNNPVLVTLEENIDHDGLDSEVPHESHASKVEGIDDQLPGVVSTDGIFPSAAEARNSKIEDPVQEKSVSVSVDVQELDKPLNFDEYDSAAELEVLGMERLKMELQARGLKCGGTVQERAARLFLLKTTPLEKLPKKLFAKK
ncbi:hypothetical protein BUALT_Bualt19G0003600 [Buddleja alternifolia]|uniref:Ubiquitin-like domain-containing protein n=1 Tax=Buddleja alternifolia TaxID=168488 RepID=A0AAV6W692_9LAMI|nr:hypothetical protein BUALT_Bualt19G0003600 [Buddleja alternifolia]